MTVTRGNSNFVLNTADQTLDGKDGYGIELNDVRRNSTLFVAAGWEMITGSAPIIWVWAPENAPYHYPLLRWNTNPHVIIQSDVFVLADPNWDDLFHATWDWDNSVTRYIMRLYNAVNNNFIESVTLNQAPTGDVSVNLWNWFNDGGQYYFTLTAIVGAGSSEQSFVSNPSPTIEVAFHTIEWCWK
jgi:hypothetical protein